MAYQTIAASETDANSPLNQTLMDKIRGNIDYLYQVGSQLRILRGSDPNSSDNATHTVTLDDEIDWRDRYLKLDIIVVLGSSTAVQKFLPGGDEDDKIHSDLGAHDAPKSVADLADNDYKQGFFYSAGGSSAGTVMPFLRSSGTGTGLNYYYIWVDVNDGGKLKLTYTCTSSAGKRALAWNLFIRFSEDQGGH